MKKIHEVSLSYKIMSKIRRYSESTYIIPSSFLTFPRILFAGTTCFSSQTKCKVGTQT